MFRTDLESARKVWRKEAENDAVEAERRSESTLLCPVDDAGRVADFHSLRHTFVSELANADVPSDVRRQISGHNDEKIHERYTHLGLETKRRALAHLRPLST